MKTTKLSLIAASIAFVAAFSNKSFAQENPVTFGIKGGASLSSFGGDLKDTKSAVRYRLGLTTDIALTNNLFVFTGLDFQTKGAKYASKGGSEAKYNPIYAQIPLSIGYKVDLAPNTKFVVHAGGYAAYGIAGKIKNDPNNDKRSVFGKDGFKRLDYGLLGGVGVEFGKIAVSAGYEYGLANINNAGPKISNRNPYLTIGYKF